MENKAEQNIEEAQLRQRESYAKRNSKSDTNFKPSDSVLLKNLRRNDRKGGWSLMPWIGPFVIEKIYDKNTCTLRKGDRVLKKTQHLKNIKMFFRRPIDDLVIDSDPEDLEVSIPISSTERKLSKQKFRPISKYWMLNQSKSLKIDISTIKYVVKKLVKPLTTPKTTIDVTGDGNCWYRCISVWINGSEEHHELIRTNLYQVILFTIIYENLIFIIFFCSLLKKIAELQHMLEI